MEIGAHKEMQSANCGEVDAQSAKHVHGYEGYEVYYEQISCNYGYFEHCLLFKFTTRAQRVICRQKYEKYLLKQRKSAYLRLFFMFFCTFSKFLFVKSNVCSIFVKKIACKPYNHNILRQNYYEQDRIN